MRHQSCSNDVSSAIRAIGEPVARTPISHEKEPADLSGQRGESSSKTRVRATGSEVREKGTSLQEQVEGLATKVEFLQQILTGGH